MSHRNVERSREIRLWVGTLISCSPFLLAAWEMLGSSKRWQEKKDKFKRKVARVKEAIFS